MTRPKKAIDVRGGYCGECGHMLLVGHCPEHGVRVTVTRREWTAPEKKKPTRQDGRTIVGMKRRGITAKDAS